jgi:hypothetical protein
MGRPPDFFPLGKVLLSVSAISKARYQERFDVGV